MSDITETTLVEDLLVELPGCTPDLTVRTLRRVAMDFFTQTGAWREAETLPVEGDEINVSGFVGEVVRPTAVRFEGRGMNQWSFRFPDRLVLAHVPATVAEVEVVLRPRQNREIGRDLVSRFYEALRAGALSRLFSMPAKPWSNDRLAVFHGRRFSMLQIEAKTGAQQGENPARVNWSYPPFARGGRP